MQFGPTLKASRATAPETETQRARRAALLGIVGGVGRDHQVLAAAARIVDRYLISKAEERIAPELLDAYVGLAALIGDRALYDRYMSRAEAARTLEERYRFLYALAAFRDEALIQRTIAYAMSPHAVATRYLEPSVFWQTLEEIEACATLAVLQQPILLSALSEGQ